MISCGTDIVKVDRIKDSIEKYGETFIKKIYTDEEINYCESRRMCKYESYAARFAAKEATYKAICSNKNFDASWRDVEICKYESGKPFIKLHGEIEKIAEQKNIKNIDVTLSHENEFAIACVVMD